MKRPLVRIAVSMTCALAVVALPQRSDAAHRLSRPTREMMHRAERTTWDSVFTAEQATRGQTTYSQTCSRCHQASLGGGDEAPALAGGAFLSNWNAQTLGDLHERVRTTMPTDTVGIYSRQQISDVLAYILSFNGFPAGPAELPVQQELLAEIRVLAAKP